MHEWGVLWSQRLFSNIPLLLLLSNGRHSFLQWEVGQKPSWTTCNVWRSFPLRQWWWKQTSSPWGLGDHKEHCSPANDCWTWVTKQGTKSLWSNALRFCLFLKHNPARRRWEFPLLNSCSVPSGFSLLRHQEREVRHMRSYKVTGLMAECHISLSHSAPGPESIHTQPGIKTRERVEHIRPQSGQLRGISHTKQNSFIHSFSHSVGVNLHLNQLILSKMYRLTLDLISVTAKSILWIFFFCDSLHSFTFLGV